MSLARHSSKWVRIEGGATPLLSKKEGPPTLFSEALLSKKSPKMSEKGQKLRKMPKVGQRSQK
jgi:hypothetical protein